MDTLQNLFNFLIHVDHYLIPFITSHGSWAYLLVFCIIFCETGLVIMPFLPGDSLLFTVGSIAALSPTPITIAILLPLFIFAAWLGNTTNFFIGKQFGTRILSDSKWINPKHLENAHQFYEKHGGKTLLYARFVPVIRTFAPFVAGISQMRLTLFQLYNLSSAILWIGILLIGGYLFGSLPLIKNHFSLVIYGIIILSLLPPCLLFLRQKRQPAT